MPQPLLLARSRRQGESVWVSMPASARATQTEFLTVLTVAGLQRSHNVARTGFTPDVAKG